MRGGSRRGTFERYLRIGTNLAAAGSGKDSWRTATRQNLAAEGRFDAEPLGRSAAIQQARWRQTPTDLSTIRSLLRRNDEVLRLSGPAAKPRFPRSGNSPGAPPERPPGRVENRAALHHRGTETRWFSRYCLTGSNCRVCWCVVARSWVSPDVAANISA